MHLSCADVHAQLDTFIDDEPIDLLDHTPRSMRAEVPSVEHAGRHTGMHDGMHTVMHNGMHTVMHNAMRSALATHLRHCAACDRQAQELRAVRRLLHDVGQRDAAYRRAPDALRERVTQLLSGERT